MTAKRILTLCLLLVSLPAFSGQPTLDQVRMKFFEIENNAKACREMIEMLEPFDAENNPIFLGYKGVATLIMAKHVGNPISKFSYFSKGRNLLEKAIQKKPCNSELRYLRFAVQTNIPGFLGYNKEIKGDEEFLYKHAPKLQDEALKLHILDYLKYVAKHNKSQVRR